MIVTIEWEEMQRRRASVEVPDDASDAQITQLAVAAAATRRNAGLHDEIVTDALGHVGWRAPDGRFGGRVQ